MVYTEQYLNEAIKIINQIEINTIEQIVDLLATLKKSQGRLFFLGVGGSAANCSHAVNDFRKIVGIEAYTPTDNIAELTARINDNGWATTFVDWLKVSKLTTKDMVFVFSVGGGDLANNISPNIVIALQYAKSIGTKIVGIVGRNGGYTAQVAHACIIIPTINQETITPQAEAFQAVLWHLIVSHPKLTGKTKM
ncbi:Phosphoheptose isomerase [Legionella busanensis]|uniref:Phosphoheptose isomerase n=1 Tax=Legionella busanensis TaxID=190655 RepID=A0A378JQF8_9GAMM|nr:SIS domain-containing protein [Legionella busanensis]STX52409.1 Phosphoheptose isomerase [Legionella busanensis]